MPDPGGSGAAGARARGNAPGDRATLGNDAMWSIFYWSHFGSRPPALPPGLEPMSIPDAVQALLRTSRRKGRPWRALTRLLVAQLHRDPDPAIRSAVRQVASAVEVDVGDFDGCRDQRSVCAKLGEIVKSGAQPDPCQTIPLGWDVELPEPNVTRARVRCQVLRSIPELAMPCDPQSWDDCTEAFLEATKVFIVGDGWIDTSAPRGEPWAGQFFESVLARLTWRTLLNVVYRPDYAPNEIFMGYSLYRAVDVRWQFFEAEAPILRDRGYLYAENTDCDEWTNVTVVKEIKYADLTPRDPCSPYDWGQIFNDLAPVLLGYWMESGLGESLCCDVPP